MLRFSSHDRSVVGSQKDKDKVRDKHRGSKDSGGGEDKPRIKSPFGKSSFNSSSKKVNGVSSSELAEEEGRDEVPELDRRESMPSMGNRRESGTTPRKTSMPYPSFSKAHSKESVAREFSDSRKGDVITPDPTDLGDGSNGKPKGGAKRDSKSAAAPPPSPPLTAVSEQPRVNGEEESRPPKSPAHERGRRSKSKTRSRSAKLSSPERIRRGKKSSTKQSARNSKQSSPSTTPQPKNATVEDAPSTILDSPNTRADCDDDVASEATSKAPGQPSKSTPPTTAAESSTGNNDKDSISPPLNGDADSPFSIGSPQPPPPPPPPMPVSIPRVDYLLYNGGLPRNVPRSLLYAAPQYLSPSMSQQYSQPMMSPRTPAPSGADLEKLFAPYHGLLEHFNTVVTKNGSLAVATGYRSVARRLLDRLEAVFARKISTCKCDCVMCQNRSPTPGVEERDLGWGDLLEWVSGRQELPVWPAFDTSKFGGPMTPALEAYNKKQDRSKTPNIDIDVPEEFREHYVQQSKVTKHAVDKWLSQQPANPTSPPQEIDDDTLTFAILTHLEPDERSIFTALVTSQPLGSELPSRVPTPAGVERPRSELLRRTGLAIQRLYRLSEAPRDPESAIFLLRHPILHNLLTTLSDVTGPEWDVLVSGRFDGFLWSGADETSDSPGPGRVSSPAPGHTPTATPPRATSTPGPPVAYDEETEIAVLAEIEREIYTGMEALEDAFESLHRKAETVRELLRERGAGLSIRRGGPGGRPAVEVVNGTPAPAPAVMTPGQPRTPLQRENTPWEDLRDDQIPELAPDDSASNISTSRHRRPKRRNERRTPAPLEEE